MYLKSLILVHAQNVTVLIFSIFPLLYVGIPEEIRERLRQYTDAGVEQFLLAFQDPLDTKAIELFVDAIDR
jgi:alkanesulfonate monooxygenase SsuD/methylene tetrahydromethanopterin reductase-like flavin-dependent oxidoreductase (luciferase family)